MPTLVILKKIGIVAGLTPVIGKGLATGAAGLILGYTGLRGNTLTTKGN